MHLPEKKFEQLTDVLRDFKVETELDRKLIKGLFEDIDNGDDKDEEKEVQQL